MKKNISFLICLLFGFFLLSAQNVKYSEESGISKEDFFEKNYRKTWNKLSETEQFAIACSSNIFQRNKQFHLDFSNRTLLDKNSHTGKAVLNDNWDIFSYDDLMKSFKEMEQGEQAADYEELKALLEKYPDLTEIEIGKKEARTISDVSRMYFIRDKKDLLGRHGIEAWIEAREISIIRWAIGAGYISEKEGYSLIGPIVKKIKDDYKSFEDFISHWLAGYCYNAVFDSNCPECTFSLLKAQELARAYIPFEELRFTGKNADENHTMTLNDGVYTPSELASRFIPFQKFYKKYWKEEASETILDELLLEEEKYPEVSDLLLLPRAVLMSCYRPASEVVKYIEEKENYISSISKQSEIYLTTMQLYISNLIVVNYPEKVLALYKQLPAVLQADEEMYYAYAYANYQMAFKCATVTEKDIYNSRAADAFKRLKNRGYDIGSFIENWLKRIDG